VPELSLIGEQDKIGLSIPLWNVAMRYKRLYSERRGWLNRSILFAHKRDTPDPGFGQRLEDCQAAVLTNAPNINDTGVIKSFCIKRFRLFERVQIHSAGTYMNAFLHSTRTNQVGGHGLAYGDQPVNNAGAMVSYGMLEKACF
jgi:hypothetical protein